MAGLILKIDCPDQPGLVAKIAGYVAQYAGNLVEFNQFTDQENKRFFARLEIDTSQMTVGVTDFVNGFEVMGKSLGGKWHFRHLPYRMKTAILVTKTDHCLNEILWRTRLGELPIEVTAVIGNREDCRELAEREGLPFRRVDLTRDKEGGFQAIARQLEEEKVELIVLARFMQILPHWLCERFSGKIINIHHSFLPAFMGANPYRKAYDRGVKLIGATCHYVTKDLDAGPIIEQEVARVQHTHSAQDMVRLGRDCERSALAKGIRYHVQDRTIIDGSRAIVFGD